MSRYDVQQDTLTGIWHVLDTQENKRIWEYQWYGDAKRTQARLNKSIVISWDIEDVQCIDESLTEEQAIEVLLFIRENHDANVGVNWDVIESAIEHLFSD